jgi:general secretion pathway protein D
MNNHKIFITVFLCIFLPVLLSSLSFAQTIKEDQKITFNFIDVEITTVIKFISEITGKNFIFDERVKGKVTILTPSELNIEESFSLFTSVLELKGFTVVPSGTKAYKIIPSTMAKQAGKTFTDWEGGVDESYITRLLQVVHIKADEALRLLQPIISRNGHISAFGPSNQLLVVDSALNIEKIESILLNIDQPPTYQEPVEIHVYPLENADATELAKVLDGIIKGSRTAAKQLKKPALAQQQLLADILITPDKATNSLIIVSAPQHYRTITKVIKELDKRRRQVYVEAMIVEASIDKIKELGTKWRATVRHNEEPVTIGGFGTLSSTAIQEILTGLAGFTLGGMGNFLDVPVTTVNSDGTFSTSSLTVPGFAALFDLSEFRDAINVLSAPQILTSDNEEAEIVVGENVPFISKSQRDLSTTDTVLSSIERQDVGITLKIKPQITEGDYVKLDLYQEISSVKEESENITISVGPTTTKRATSTSVVVRDQQTVVISGLMEEEEEDSIVKLPLLGDLPILGWLFKHKSRISKKTNLLIFVTPHIVKDSIELSQITSKKHDEFSTREKHYVEGELLIKFKEGVSPERVQEIISQAGASVLTFNRNIGIYQIKLRPDQEVEDAVKEFTANPDVLYAEPNYKIKIQKAAPEPLQTPQQEGYGVD